MPEDVINRAFVLTGGGPGSFLDAQRPADSVIKVLKVDADQYRQVGTVLARLFLVQIFFYGLNALATALLNARR